MATFTDDLNAVENSVNGLPFGSPTLIRGAVEGAVMELHGQKPIERRRAVLAATGNMGLHSGSVHSIVNSYWEGHALLSGLILESPSAKTMRRTNNSLIAVNPVAVAMNKVIEDGIGNIVSKTGGDFLRSNDPAVAFQDMMHVSGRATEFITP